jgi:hypothetical protein
MKPLIQHNLFQRFFTLLLLTGSTAVFAGTPNGVLAYNPLNSITATPVPTLNGYMLVVLGLLFVAVSFRIAQQKNISGKHFLFGLFSAGTVLYGVGSNTFIHQANAGGSVTVVASLGSAQGGTAAIVPNTVNEYTNTSGVSQRITSTSLPVNCPNSSNGFVGNKCVVGTNLANTQMCYISCLPIVTTGDGIG